MSRITKTDLVAAVAEKAGVTKTTAKSAVDAMIEVITEAMTSGTKVSLTGFGTFESREAKERSGVNPRTGEKIVIPATKRPAFSAGAVLKRVVKDS